MNKKLLAVFLVLLVSAIGGWGLVFSLGSIPDADGTIYGCYQTHNNDQEKQGQLRVVGEPSKCKNNETPLSWNQPAQSNGSQIIGNRGNVTLGFTFFHTFFGGHAFDADGPDALQVMPIAGLVSDLYVQADPPPDVGAGIQTYTFAIAKNKFATALGCSISEAATECSDLNDTVCLDVGDQGSLKQSGTTSGVGGPTDFSAFGWTVLFTPITGSCPP